MMTTMGLNVVVGIRNQISMDDTGDGAVADFREDVESVRTALTQSRLPAWDEPEIGAEEGADFALFGYSGVHSLRRLAAHLEVRGVLPPPDEDDDDAVNDPVLQEVYDRGPNHWIEPTPGGQPIVHGRPDAADNTFDHLIHHSDAEGCYVPIDFAPVVIDQRAYGGYIGSAHRLLDECLRLAVALSLPQELDPDSDEVWDAADGTLEGAQGWQRYGIESYTCLRLIDAARRAIATGAAVFFI
jgi:hypothetical protein